VLRNEGILGFWRGNGLNILRTAPYKVGAAAHAAPDGLISSGHGQRCHKVRVNAVRCPMALELTTCALGSRQAVNFSSYDAYRKLMQLHSGGRDLGRMGSFGAGALAGRYCLQHGSLAICQLVG
jgi:Mitochondrial carrier protein